MKEAILKAAKAEAIPKGWSGLWFILKATHEKPTFIVRGNRAILVPSGIYTMLYRMTDATMHLNPPGEVVMEDTPVELLTHLNFMLKATGRVLVTGLGLGCVVRGLLANPNVEHVTCIERSTHVLNLVQPYMPADRLEIIQADALEWTRTNRQRFDCAWHDLWTNREIGEPALDRWHVELMFNCMNYTGFQGAWNLDRRVKAMAQRRLANII